MTYRIVLLLGIFGLAGLAHAESFSEQCAEAARRLGLYSESQFPAAEKHFEAWLYANLNFPQRGFASTIAVSNQLLQNRGSAAGLIDSQLTRDQLKQVRIALKKVHRAFRISPHGIAQRLMFGLRPLLNNRLQTLWSTVAGNSTSVLGNVMKEIDRTYIRSLNSEQRRHLGWDIPRVRAKQIDEVLTTPAYEALAAKTTEVFALFEAALHDRLYRQAATKYRNQMRGGGPLNFDEVQALIDAFSQAAQRQLEVHPIEGIDAEGIKDLVLYVQVHSG